MTTALQQTYLSKRLQLYEKSLIVLERELEWRQENERIQFYEPNEPVEKLIRMAGTESNLLYILSAANGIGKTTALVNIAGNIIFGPQNSFFKFPIFEKWPYPKRIRFVSEPSQVKESGPFPTEIQKWWPKGRYIAQKDGQHYASIYKSGGWILEVMTYEQLPEQHEGANLGCVMFNEPPPKNLWTPNISRLRAGGIAFVAMTPLTEAGWFFDEVVPRHEPYIVYGDVEKACKKHGIRGHLEHDQIEKMISEYSQDEREARIDGKAMYLKGLIFKAFNSQVHVLKETVVPPSNATVYQVIDPHSDKPFACIWAFVNGIGDVYIFDEWPNIDFYKWYNCQLTIPEYLKIFKDKEQGLTVYKRIIDRHFAEISHLSGMTRKTLRDELGEHGLQFMPSYQCAEEIDTGIEAVRGYLKYNSDRPIDTLNKPKLFINPHCQNTIRSLSRWTRNPKDGKVEEAFKDFCDCVRYLVMDSPEVDKPAPYSPPKKMWG